MNEELRLSKRITVSFFILILLFAGCGSNVKKTLTDTPTSGTVKIGVDDSYKLLAEAEIFTFQSFYK